MVRACTLLDLDTFRSIIGWNPLHFWQLSNEDYSPLTNACSTLLREYSWQNAGAAGRTEIAEAIATAEKRLTDYLKFSPISHYVTDVVETGCLQHNFGAYQGAGQPGFVRLNEGKVTRLATETATLIDDAAAVVYTDEDGDGLDDTFAVTINDSATDPADIEVYFSSGDQLVPFNTSDYLCRWQIRPVVTTRTNANTIVVKGARWLCVKPVRYESFVAAAGYNNDTFGNLDSSGALDPTVATNFVTRLGVYKRETSATNQATLVYTNGDGSESSYSFNVTLAAASSGLVALRIAGGADCPCTCGYGFWNPYGAFGAYQNVGYPAYPSVRLEINYRAGGALADWQTIVTRLALAELKKRICACEDANMEIYRWQQDLARANGVTEEQFRISNEALGNPLGTLRGQIYAWERIKDRGLTRGIRVG
jgi:hypothetical protein